MVGSSKAIDGSHRSLDIGEGILPQPFETEGGKDAIERIELRWYRAGSLGLPRLGDEPLAIVVFRHVADALRQRDVCDHRDEGLARSPSPVTDLEQYGILRTIITSPERVSAGRGGADIARAP